MPWDFILGVLTYAWNILVVQIINFDILWQVVPVYICWFMTIFITKGKEYEDVANNFLNGFSVFWVALDVGKYLIEGFNEVPFALLKFLVVAGLIFYGFFIMRLAFKGKDIRKYIARIGEVSVVNIATILFVQDLMPAFANAIELLQLVLGFFMLYGIFDLVVVRSVKIYWVKRGAPAEEVPAEERPPRIKRILPEAPKPAPPVEEEPAEEPLTPPPAPVMEEEPVEEEPETIVPMPAIPAKPVPPPTPEPVKEEKPAEEETEE